jgi:hypothetical protein
MKSKSVILLAFAALLVSTASGAELNAADGGSGESTQTFTLKPGWNTVSPDVSGTSFSQDFLNGDNSCTFGWWNQQLDGEAEPSEIPESQRHYVWARWGGQWTHPDNLEPSRGYSIFLNQDTSCDVTVEGDATAAGEVTLQDGWNLVDPEGLSAAAIKESCEMRWWNRGLARGKSTSSIPDSNRYYFWVHKGEDWVHPYREGGGFRSGEAVYINIVGSCSLDLSGTAPQEEPADDETGDGEETIDETTDISDIEDRNIPYEQVRRRWDLNQEEFAALAGMPKGFAPAYPYSRQSLASLVKKLRERAVMLNWNYGARETAERYHNPEDVNYGGNTYYVSKVQGWVLDPGTPAPHCYSDHYYTPPVYGSLSDEVERAIPRADTKFSDTDEDQECPSWLTDDLLSKVSDMVEQESTEPVFELKSVEQNTGLGYTGATLDVNGQEVTVSEDGSDNTFSASGYTVTVVDIVVEDPDESQGTVKLSYNNQVVTLDNTDDDSTDTSGDETEGSDEVSWDGWTFQSQTLEGMTDSVETASGDGKAVIDTGSDGFCGEAYFQKTYSVSGDTADRLEIDYSVEADEWAGKATVWVDGTEAVEPVDPSGDGDVSTSGTWQVYLGPGESEVRFGVSDTSEEHCSITDHDIRLEVTSVSKTDTQIAGQ